MYDSETFITRVGHHFAGEGGYHVHGTLKWTKYTTQEPWYLVEISYANGGGGSGMLRLNAGFWEGQWFAQYKRGPISKDIVWIQMDPMAVAAVLAF